MPIQIRPYTPSDREAVLAAVSVVYGDGSPPTQEDELPTYRSHFVAMEGKSCSGFFAELHFDTLRGSAKLPTGGLAFVGVVPDRRHTGLGCELMRFALRGMYDRGKSLASLYPFAESFYRQFGYEVCGTRTKLEIPKSFMPKLKPSLPIRRLTWDEFDEVKACYEAFAISRSGLAARNSVLWDRLFGRKAKLAELAYEKTVYAAGDPVEAYAVVSHVVDFHVEQVVSEFVWNTLAGYESMLSFMRSLGSNKSGLRWYEPSDGPFYFRYLASSALCKISLDKPIMYRVINVPAALAALSPTGETEFSLSVTDAEIPENEGPWHVKASGGKVSVTRSSTAELRFDIRAFTQAFLGSPGIDEVVRNGFASVDSPNAVDAFRALMPPVPVYCLDMF